MNRVFVIFFLVYSVLFFKGQERLGIANSNYYSVNSIHLNPSSSVDCWTYMQFNLVGFNFSAKTNFAYIPNFSLRQAGDISGLQKVPGNNKRFLYVNASVEGPTFVFSKRTYGIGFFVRARTVVDMRRMSYELASAMLNEDELFGPSNRDLLGQDFKNAKFSTMSWAEYGINFGKMVKRQREKLITVGGNLKYLTGISINYMNIREFSSYNNDNGAFGVDNLSAKFLRNTPRWNAGRGFGLDLGITYKEMTDYVDRYYANSKQSNCEHVDYKYKLGLSLRDLGYVRFRGGGNIDTRVSGSGHFDPNRSDTSFIRAVQYNFSNNTVEGKPILASLPTSLAGTLDWNFDDYVYVNVTLVKNLVPTRITGVQGADLLSVCPRIELKYFEVALPVTFQKFRYPQLGLGLRFRSLVFGVDNVFPLFMKTNTTGFGVYFNLAVSIFKNPECDKEFKSVSDCPSYRKTGKNRPKKRKTFGSRKRK